jgi:CRISPR/Cas system-associated endoribonuclease Cas2
VAIRNKNGWSAFSRAAHPAKLQKFYELKVQHSAFEKEAVSGILRKVIDNVFREGSGEGNFEGDFEKGDRRFLSRRKR